jgi:oligosaccharide translocation protein RFT1
LAGSSSIFYQVLSDFASILYSDHQMVLMRAAERSLYRQGVYALAHTYGSLVARLLLAPAEEASRLLFSKLGSSDKPQLGNILAALLKLVILIGALFPCFGFNYTGLLLSLLFMARKAAPGMEAGTLLDVSGVLSWYCVYVLLLAVNGMCEAFVYALASRPQLSVLTWSLAVSFAVFYAVANPLMAIYGTEGLVIANCAGMCFRIAFCLRFMFAFFGGCEYLRRSLPHWSIIICLSISFVLTSKSKSIGAFPDMLAD